jgi:hypothetical protein
VSEIVWRATEREFTTWFEAESDGFELWLEWNDRVCAYRFGFTAPPNARGERTNAPSSLGFATDQEAVKALLLEAIARFQSSS